MNLRRAHRASALPPRRPLRRALAVATSIAMLTGTLVSASIAFAAPAQADPMTSLPFDKTMGLVWVAQGGPGTLLHGAVQGAGGVVFSEGELDPARDWHYNALGFHEASGYLYAMKDTSSTLLRIGQGAVVAEEIPLRYKAAGKVYNFPAGFSANQGTFGTGTASNIFYFRQASQTVLYSVDVTADVPVAIRQNLAPETRATAPVSNVADLVWKDNYLWGVDGEKQLILRINPADGKYASWNIGAGPRNLNIVKRPYGAQWQYGNGNLGISANIRGGGMSPIYQISITNGASSQPTFTKVSETVGPTSAGNDGASYLGIDVDLELTKKGIDFFVDADGVAGVASYTLTVTNKSETTPSSGFTVTDELPTILTDVTTNSPGCAITAGLIECSGPVLQPGGSHTFTFTGNPPVGTTECIENTATVTGNEDDSNDGNNISTGLACPLAPPPHSFTVKKTADVEEVLPSGDVRYTVQVSHVEGDEFTTAAPASFVDDLSGVLDDATMVTDISTPLAVFDAVDKTLSWSSALAEDEVISVSYTVTAKASGWGDSMLRNAVQPGLDGRCLTSNDCNTETPVKHYQVSKAVNVTEVAPGGVVEYEISVINTGKAAYTAALPAAFRDDLSAVLSNATFTSIDDEAGGNAEVNGNELTWSGALAVGATATVKYSVTANESLDKDATLVNAVLPRTPDGQCTSAAECTTLVERAPEASYSIKKVANKSVAQVGDDVTFTITVTNTGEIDYGVDNPLNFTDDLSDVLDDSTFDRSTIEVSSGTYDTTAKELSWSGELRVGDSAEISYTVAAVRASDGDNVLRNAVATPDGQCDDNPLCEVEVPVAKYEIVKVGDKTTAAPGDVVSYTITVTNTGNADYTADMPITFTDDLSDVFDDASFVTDSITGGATLTGDILSWTGELAIGGIATIGYQVAVDDPPTGDRYLRNYVFDPYYCVEGNDDPDCRYTLIPVPNYSVVKTSDVSAAKVGDTVTFTIAVTNTGGVIFGEQNPLAFTDDLSDVLDDASFDITSITTDTGETSYDKATTTLAWTGQLGLGGVAVVTYKAQVLNTTGDNVLRNTVRTTDGPCSPDSELAECTVEVPVLKYTVLKKVDKKKAIPGESLRYTITVTNTGEADYTEQSPILLSDDLSDVLDDATLEEASVTGGAVIDGSTLNWALAVPVGESVELSYTVTVGAHGVGDGKLRNVVTDSEFCIEDNPLCSTLTLVPDPAFTVVKKADTATVRPGEAITYTLTVTNTGEIGYTAERPASFIDEMNDVLKQAKYNGDATDGAVYDASARTLSWSDALAVGATVTVTFSVTVSADATPATLRNVVVTPPDGGCLPDTENADCMTLTKIGPPALVSTGIQLSLGVLIGLLALVSGGLLMLTRRRTA